MVPTLDLSQTQVTSIPQQAFEDAENLETVKLPAGLTTIGVQAFNRSGLQTLDLSNTALTTIDQGAFANTANLTSLKVPGSLATINSGDQDGSQTDQTMQRTFSGSALPTLDLSNTKISTINNSTFNGADKLATVKLPSSVTSIGQNAFKNTTALKTLTQAEPESAPVTRVGGNTLASTLTSIGGNAFEATGLESIDLSATGVTQISNYAFQDATSLSSVTLPTGLTTIAAASFAGTTSLKSISIPSSVTTINAGNATVLGAFEGSGLESVDLSKTQVTGATDANKPGSWPSPDGNGTHGTFSNMPNLTSVTLPAGLTTIPSYAFYKSPKLKTVSFKATASTPEAQRSTRATEGTLDFNGATALTTIGTSAFAGSAVTSIDLNGATAFTTISNSAFMGMNELTTVKLPSTVTTIGQGAFYGDAKLQTLTQANPAEASETVTHNDAEPTEGTAKFGSSLTTIQQGAFQGTGFKVVDLSGTKVTGNYNSSTSGSTGLGQNAFTNLANLEKVELPADADVSLAYFSTPAGSTKDWKIQYGSDDSLSSTVATLNTSGTSFSGAQFKRIANQKIEVAASLANGTVSLANGVFFGSSTLTTLKLNRTVANLSDNDLWAFQLGTAPSGTDVSAAYSTAPLGNNKALTNIEFILNVSDLNVIKSFNAQLASIFNMFAKYETGKTVENLAAWAVSSSEGEGSNGVLEADIADGKLNSNTDDGTKWTTTSSGQVIQNNTSSATLKHNGVTWTYKNNGASSTGREGDSTQEISITGEVNIYKSQNSGTSYQTYFTASDTTPTQTVTVKLILVPAQATAEASRK